MLNKNIPTHTLEQLKLVVFDSDGVSVPRGTQISEHVERGETNLESISMKTYIITDRFANLLNRLRRKVKVTISSGRSLLYLQGMFAPIIGENTVLTAENGNISLINGKVVQHFDYEEEYFEALSNIRLEVEKLPIKGIEPKQFILSIHSDHEIKEVYDIVKKHDPDQTLRVMWNGEAFDIQRKDVSKAAGLERLLGFLELRPEQMLAIGDRINDREMIELAGVGVSADHQKLPAEYWTTGSGLPGEILANYLVEKLQA